MNEDDAMFYMQSRYYRSPEIVLNLPYSAPIDIFSIGCIVAELITGVPLFPSINEIDHLHRYVPFSLFLYFTLHLAVPIYYFTAFYLHVHLISC